MVIIIVIGLIMQVWADLPVHCVKSQIEGKWTLEFSKPHLIGSGPLSCGHATPSNYLSSQTAGEKHFNAVHKFDVVLTSRNNVFKDKVDVGKWSMVYDEGFEIEVEDVSCFAFSKYKTNYSGVYSYCGQTLIGWYNNKVTHERGCYRAVKHEKTHQISGGSQNGHVVQPEFVQFTEQKVNKVWNKRESQSFVEQINSANLSWKAKVYDNLIGLTTKDLNGIAGRKKFSQTMMIERKDVELPKYAKRFDLSHLPKHFSWQKYLGKGYEQKSCGSCYAISTMAMLTARLRIKGEKDAQLSPQYSLDCNTYNQGCEGGYPFLVAKFASEQNLEEEANYHYKATHGKCKHPENAKYRVKNFHFIGGAYGMSHERNIMEEIHANGPVVMNFEPSFDFMFYVGGIYHSTVPDWIINGMARPEWEKVDHSVLCYGWGEEDGDKFWLLQNSWGKEWGENGFFRMRRGVDESAIESMAEAAEPELIK